MPTIDMPPPPAEDDWWPEPTFSPEGQLAFWDIQADGYESADMTLDNQGELSIVTDLCHDYLKHGYELADVVSLGGAVGCRDPLVVLDALAANNRQPQTVYFNDLSPAMTAVASSTTLGPYRDKGIRVVAENGPIHRLSTLPARPRRIILGVYRCGALTRAAPQEAYPVSGLNEYWNNRDILGEHITVEPMLLQNGRYESIAPRIPLSRQDGTPQLHAVQETLEAAFGDESTGVVQVVGRDRDREGFFLSHWFGFGAIKRLAAVGMLCHGQVQVKRCAKGWVLCIDPPNHPPEGILTVLNNVIGNVLPEDLPKTLATVRALTQ